VDHVLTILQFEVPSVGALWNAHGRLVGLPNRDQWRSSSKAPTQSYRKKPSGQISGGSEGQPGKRGRKVTRPGAWLRRWSLDELPQLINVLIGDMSLVGPRPALPEEVASYGGHMRRRLVVKPGLTGLWQVSGRSDLSQEEAERLDVHYVENWSLVLDLQVLWKTGSAVVRGSGAY